MRLLFKNKNKEGKKMLCFCLVDHYLEKLVISHLIIVKIRLSLFYNIFTSDVGYNTITLPIEYKRVKLIPHHILQKKKKLRMCLKFKLNFKAAAISIDGYSNTVINAFITNIG